MKQPLRGSNRTGIMPGSLPDSLCQHGCLEGGGALALITLELLSNTLSVQVPKHAVQTPKPELRFLTETMVLCNLAHGVVELSLWLPEQVKALELPHMRTSTRILGIFVCLRGQTVLMCTYSWDRCMHVRVCPHMETHRHSVYVCIMYIYIHIYT